MSNSTQIILITGGAGFIGSHTCEAFLREGYTVVCVDNFSNYYSPVQKEKNIESCIQSQNFFLARGDICDEVFLNNVFNYYRPSVVIHLAAAVGVRHSLVDPELYARVNILGTENVLRYSEKYHVEHILFASSSSVYGEQAKGPFNDGTLITEKPLSFYAETKMLGEHALFRWCAATGKSATCFRFFTVYGPRGRRDMFPYILADRISNNREIIRYGNGDTMRDYTYVDDIVDALVAAVKHLKGFNIINLGNGIPVSLQEAIATFEKVINKSARIVIEPLHRADVFLTHANINQAQQKIAFQPKVSFQEGVRRFMAWFNSSDHIPDR